MGDLGGADAGAELDRRKILLLANIDPIVGACIKLWRDGEITFERALVMSVTDLALQAREYREEIERVRLIMPSLHVVTDKDESSDPNDPY